VDVFNIPELTSASLEFANEFRDPTKEFSTLLLWKGDTMILEVPEHADEGCQ
jgi:hypothetical protein